MHAGKSTMAKINCTVSSREQNMPKCATTSHGERPDAAKAATPTTMEWKHANPASFSTQSILNVRFRRTVADWCAEVCQESSKKPMASRLKAAVSGAASSVMTSTCCRLKK